MTHLVLDLLALQCILAAMKTTKQTFEFTATLIKAVNEGASAADLALLAVSKFEQDNPRFDAERFLDACGNPLAPPPTCIAAQAFPELAEAAEGIMGLSILEK
jgi:hypothetical protein|tara:strand:- start:433 stop:741 length:309 start_codon:yes stop_codon:yes gene_type:complete